MKTIIDIGSNSVRLLSNKKGYLEEKISYTRLSEGTTTLGKITEKAYLRTLEGVKELLKDEAKESKIFIFATSALREATNRKEIENRFFKDLGYFVHVLTSEEEAKYNYIGVKTAIAQDVLLLDIGGGSTELVMMQEGQLMTRSLPIGAVRFYEAKETFLPLNEYFLPFMDFKESMLTLVGTGGTITSLAMLLQDIEQYNENLVDGYRIEKKEIVYLLEAFKQSSFLLNKVIEKRRDIFPSGLMLLLSLMDFLGKDSLIVSTKDGLYGLYQEIN